MSLIQLSNISKIYTGTQNRVYALDGINLSIEQGEFVAIVGRSGSGKSTLLNIIGTLDTQSEGEYLLNGKNISAMSDAQLSAVRSNTIGFIFQGFNLITNLDALDNVAMPLLYRGMKRSERIKRAEQALEKVGLSNRMSHLPSQMSGGQQQRVAIARAIACAPPVILADEPTGNLDSASGKEIIELLKGLNRAGHTVIMITHDMEMASQIPRTVQIADGKITPGAN